MTHEEAIKSLNTLIKNDTLKKHSLACGACMKGLAFFLKDKHTGLSLFGLGSGKDIDETSWEMIGLLHDADYERTKDRPVEHGPIVVDEIRSLGYKLTPEEIEAIKFHNFENTHARESLLGWSIYCVEPITGLIVACAQGQKDRKLSSLTLDFVLSKMKDPAFVPSASREKINLCKEKISIDLEDFVRVCLESMQSVAVDLGL